MCGLEECDKRGKSEWKSKDGILYCTKKCLNDTGGSSRSDSIDDEFLHVTPVSPQRLVNAFSNEFPLIPIILLKTGDLEISSLEKFARGACTFLIPTCSIRSRLFLFRNKASLILLALTERRREVRYRIMDIKISITNKRSLTILRKRKVDLSETSYNIIW